MDTSSAMHGTMQVGGSCQPPHNPLHGLYAHHDGNYSADKVERGECVGCSGPHAVTVPFFIPAMVPRPLTVISITSCTRNPGLPIE